MNQPRLQARYAINVLHNDRGEILLLRRHPESRLGGGLWGFVGGHIREGYGPVRDTWYGGVFEVHLYLHHWLGGDIILNHEHTAYAWVDRDHYCDYAVMDGVDEDLYYLGVWPVEYLHKDKLP